VNQITGWLSSTAGLGVLGASIAFIWSSTQQIIQRRAEAREREFQTFHRLVKDLVSPEGGADGKVWEDRQAAVAFELRNFPRYYEFTERMLKRLRDIWGPWPRLIEEINLTLEHIQRSK
jgi:hypothetical protein